MATYARQAIARASGAGGWTISGTDASLSTLTSFPAMAGGAGGTVTHFGVGTAVSGAGHLLFFGTVTPNISVVAGVTPKLDTGTKVSNATPDAMTNEAATNFLTNLFNNANWSNIGDATGIRGSSTAGSLYLSLHTSSPGEAGDQTTNEISYT
jgi:hypothetical protein